MAIYVVHEHLEFNVARNEFVCICGPSGCGKTTLLDYLAGILTDAWLSTDRRRYSQSEASEHLLSYFRSLDQFPWLTVFDNVATGLRIKGGTVRRSCEKGTRDHRLVGLTGFKIYYPHQISGGMKQRVAIARAFATDADLILMDEPFVSLDQPTRERMQREVLDIWQRHVRTVIFVTHNIEEAVFLGDRILILSEKPARIIADLPVR